MNCILCGSKTTVFFTIKKNNKTYHQCNLCRGIFLDPSFLLAPREEEDRYLLHNNDENDFGYIRFVSPILEEIEKKQEKSQLGLDFGSGPNPIITSILKNQGYKVENYDPFFAPNPKILSKSYDFIICCEVMEHFYDPLKEFRLLYNSLHDHGYLYCKTLVYQESFDFENWWYKNDPTHVFFYTNRTLLWIKEKLGFRNVMIKKDIILYEK